MNRREFFKASFEGAKKIGKVVKKLAEEKFEELKNTEVTRREFLQNPLNIQKDESSKADQPTEKEEPIKGDKKMTRRDFLTGKWKK